MSCAEVTVLSHLHPHPSGAVVVPLSGLHDQTELPVVVDTLRKAMDSCDRVVVDLSDVAAMDFRIISVLMWAGTMAVESGVRLVLAAPSSEVTRVLANLQLDTLLTAFPDIEAAAASLGARASVNE